MSDKTHAEEQTFTAQEVPVDDRIDVQAKHHGRHISYLETLIFNSLSKMCPAYTGGFWVFYETSNGTFFMAPDMEEKLTLSVEGNFFSGEVSAQAAGIVACLVAYNRLCWETQTDQDINRFHALRDFALEHEEAPLIMAAID
jgi:hypothetical protein